jgi:hypothetical protein
VPGHAWSIQICKPVTPVVRALARRGHMATRERTATSQKYLRNWAERRSAWTKSHQAACSYCAKRRSRQLVSSVRNRLPTNRTSTRGRSRSLLIASFRMSARSWRPLGKRVTTSTGGASIRARRVREVATRLSATPLRLSGNRDARHGVGQVAVEGWEEAEAVLAGQVAPAVAAAERHEAAAGLAAGGARGLVNGDLEAALSQLVRRAQPGHTAADDRNRAGLGSTNRHRLPP